MTERVAVLRAELIELSTLVDSYEADVERQRQQLSQSLLALKILRERRDHLREIVGRKKKS